MNNNNIIITYSADNFVSVIASKKHVHGHCVILLVNIDVIAVLRGIVGVDTKQVAAKQHHQTTNNHYGVDVRSRVSDQPEESNKTITIKH